ncbi:MAG: hypothetical protein JEY79_12625 [Pseudodesulfovibrio sp.]|nr:hypothetical protein [Pseudodesulfovibrio sp.]
MNRHCKSYGVMALLAFFLLSASCAWAGDAGFVKMADRARECGVSSGMIGQIESFTAEGSLSDAEAVSLLLPLVAACADNFPLASFEDKLAEGFAKQVGPFSIVRALDRKLDEFRFARDMLQDSGGGVAQQALVVLGEGLSKGVPRQDFKTYVSMYGDHAPELFLTGLEMMSLLSQAGFDFRLTRSMLDVGFAGKGLSPEWRYFVRIVLVARQRGLTDDAIAEAAGTVLEDSGSLADVAVHLGFTSRDLSGRGLSN